MTLDTLPLLEKTKGIVMILETLPLLDEKQRKEDGHGPRPSPNFWKKGVVVTLDTLPLLAKRKAMVIDIFPLLEKASGHGQRPSLFWKSGGVIMFMDTRPLLETEGHHGHGHLPSPGKEVRSGHDQTPPPSSGSKGGVAIVIDSFLLLETEWPWP